MIPMWYYNIRGVFKRRLIVIVLKIWQAKKLPYLDCRSNRTGGSCVRTAHVVLSLMRGQCPRSECGVCTMTRCLTWLRNQIIIIIYYIGREESLNRQSVIMIIINSRPRDDGVLAVADFVRGSNFKWRMYTHGYVHLMWKWKQDEIITINHNTSSAR